MEGAIGDTEQGLELGVVSVLPVALQESQRGDEVTLFQKVIRVWQFQFFLLYAKRAHKGDTSG
jgi:hypothetical protein